MEWMSARSWNSWNKTGITIIMEVSIGCVSILMSTNLDHALYLSLIGSTDVFDFSQVRMSEHLV